MVSLRLSLVLLCLLPLPAVNGAGGIFQPPTPVTIDVNRYIGSWYEIATSWIPKFTFERGLICNRAQYTLLQDANGEPYVDVLNSGVVKSTGVWTSVHGQATPLEPVVDGKTVARLSVSFSGNQTTNPNYIVIYIGGDYETAVVTDSMKLTIFFLSRTPTVSTDEYNRMKKAAKDNGVMLWLIGLVQTKQDADVCSTQQN